MPNRATISFTIEYLSQQRPEMKFKNKEYDDYSNEQKLL